MAATNPQATPVPVTLSIPGMVSAADYAQLQGLAFADKIRQIRGILREAQASRTPQQLAAFGPFQWEEAQGPSGEAVFIGPGGPATIVLPTVILIKPSGEVFRMLPTGLTSVVSFGPPKVLGFDLALGQAQLMAV